MHSARLALALLLVLGTAATARAATFSSPIVSIGAGSALFCHVTNVGKKSIKVTATLQDFDGSVLAASDNCLVVAGGVLSAGGSCSTAVAGPATARCTIVASSGKVRVHMWVRDSGGNPIMSVPATQK